MLIAEDLMLLLMDDEKGRLAAAAHARPLFGGALLVELALAGSVRLGEKRGFWQSAKVAPTSDTPSADPLLAQALAAVAEKPRSAQDLVQRLGKGLREELQERLVGRGILQRHDDKILGLFPTSTWPAADVSHERQLRDRLHAVLVQGLEPDPRTAGLVALLSAVDHAHKVVDRGTLSAGQVRRRAKEIADGDWGADAVKDAVAAAQAAVVTAVVASTAATSGGS